MINNNITNTPASFNSIFLDVEQVLGPDGSKLFIDTLKASIPDRASAIVASGGFRSVGGMEAILEEQAKQIIDQKGMCPVQWVHKAR